MQVVFSGTSKLGWMSYFPLVWLLYNFIHSLRLSSDITSSEQPYLTPPLWFRYPFHCGSVSGSSCPTLCRPMDCTACQAYLSLTISQSLLKLMFIVSRIPSNHLILCCPLLLPSIFPASGSFPVSSLSASGGQSIGASILASVLQMNIQGWFPLGLTGLISLLSKGLSNVFCCTTVQNHQFFGAQSSLWFTSHIYI